MIQTAQSRLRSPRARMSPWTTSPPQGLLADSSEVEAENDCLGDMNFFPCPQSPFLEPMFQCGGKLTLDAVKIDCSFLD
uniref:Uncharacterized protein n=1 Tax=Anguilla anguilla TaxID=7936 RepID=A0A0E9WCR6_ANGAN